MAGWSVMARRLAEAGPIGKPAIQRRIGPSSDGDSGGVAGPAGSIVERGEGWLGLAQPRLYRLGQIGADQGRGIPQGDVAKPGFDRAAAAVIEILLGAGDGERRPGGHGPG